MYPPTSHLLDLYQPPKLRRVYDNGVVVSFSHTRPLPLRVFAALLKRVRLTRHHRAAVRLHA